jgi:uncharacterized membrane protein YkvA (DUF1232 family)
MALMDIRLYDELRKRLVERGSGISPVTMNGALLLPDALMLLLRLSRDSRLPRRHRILASSALLYVLSPIDIIPGWLFGPAGFLDDITLAVLVVHRLVGDTPEDILREHWSGDPLLLPVVTRVVGVSNDWLRSGIKYRLHGLVRQGLSRIARV